MIVSAELVFVGIDVGKFTCVAAVHGRKDVASFAPDAPGIARFLSLLRGLQGEVRVGLEATGGYEAALWEALEQAGFHVRQLSPSRVHAFARSLGRLSKTDRYDAVTIAAYLAANPGAGRRLPAANIRQISALYGKRRQLIEMRKALACQTKQTRDPMIIAMNTEHLALIEAQIATLKTQVDALIAACPDLAEKRRLLRTSPASARSPAPRFWPRCPSWVRCGPALRHPWQASPRSAATAERSAANATSRADAASFAASSIWPRSPHASTIPASNPLPPPSKPTTSPTKSP